MIERERSIAQEFNDKSTRQRSRRDFLRSLRSFAQVNLTASVFVAASQAVRSLAVEPASGPYRAPITSVAQLPSGSLVVGSSNGIERVDRSGTRVPTGMETSLTQITRMRFDATGRSLVVSGGIPGESGSLELWDWETAQLKWTKILHDDVTTDFAFAAEDLQYITCSMDSSVGVHRQKSEYLQGHSRSVLCLEYLIEHDLLVSAGRDQSLRTWELSGLKSVRTLDQHTGEVLALAQKVPTSDLEKARPILASSGTDKTIRFWQPTIGRLVRFVRLPSIANDIQWLPESDTILAACRDGNLRAIDSRSLKERGKLELSSDWLMRTLVSSSDDKLWVTDAAGALESVSITELIG